MPGQTASLGNSPDRETEHHNKSQIVDLDRMSKVKSSAIPHTTLISPSNDNKIDFSKTGNVEAMKVDLNGSVKKSLRPQSAHHDLHRPAKKFNGMTIAQRKSIFDEQRKIESDQYIIE